jgi:putative Mn2+ efflux pump MntP
MNLLNIITIALGLSADAFAVSIVSGAAYKKLHIAHVFRIALFFGLFQAVMPLVGYAAALSVEQFIAPFDHWIAFALLSAIGAKMIFESLKLKTDQPMDPSKISILLILSIATSIDALAVGVTLSLLSSSITLAVIIIGLITFALSWLGVYIGKKLGHFFENKIEAIGGIILIAIGIKILLQHTLT